jgi:hypothetical protein
MGISNVPPKFLAFADAHIINVVPIIRGIGLQYGRHYLGKPLANHSHRLGITVVYRSSEIEAFRNKGFMLKETIKMVPIFKNIFPTQICNQ